MRALLPRRLLRASGRALLPFAFAAAAVGITGATLVGCDQADAATADDTALSLSSAADAATSAAAPESLLARITRELSLTTAQAALVRTSVAERQPGGLWTLTAALAPTLSAAQTATLLTFPAPPSGRPPQGTPPGDRPPAGSRPPQAPPPGDRPGPPSEADRAADQAAMKAALGLTDAQAAALAALPRPAPPAPGTPAPSGAMAVPDAVKAILNEAQQALFAVHHGLLVRLMPPPPPGGPR